MNVRNIFRQVAKLGATIVIAIPAQIKAWTVYFNYHHNQTFSVVDDTTSPNTHIDSQIEKIISENANFTRLDSGSTFKMLTELCAYDCSEIQKIGDSETYFPQTCYLKLYGAVNSFLENFSDNDLKQLQDACEDGINNWHDAFWNTVKYIGVGAGALTGLCILCCVIGAAAERISKYRAEVRERVAVNSIANENNDDNYQLLIHEEPEENNMPSSTELGIKPIK